MTRTRRWHPAWTVTAVAFLALVAAAGFRAAPSALMVPVEQSLGFDRTVLSTAIAVNLLLFGLTAPFAASLMERFGVRNVVTLALLLIGGGAGLSTLATRPWHMVATWGVLIGLGTGSMALVFAATVVNAWFLRNRGLVMGVLTSGSAAGQLLILPLVAWTVDHIDWTYATWVVTGFALAVIPLVRLFLHESPAALGVTPYGTPPGVPVVPVRVSHAPGAATAAAARTVRVLVAAMRYPTFWYLAIGFAVCGATTNGLVGTHFIPGAHDHGMPTTVAAGLLALVGIFDIIGTVASGWLSDRLDPKWLLAAYYFGRGIALVALPSLLDASVRPSMWFFIVFYGLDWVATVPPTSMLCARAFGKDATIVFGWVFAAHQIGAAAAALGAGWLRAVHGSYTLAWVGGAGLCAVATFVTVAIGRTQHDLRVRPA
ncbi:MFS transporter [Mariniluteicoccus endophyticus]